VSEFLRRSGIGRTHLYALIDAREVETFLDGTKRMIMIASWAAYIARRQEAERTGKLGKRKGSVGRRGFARPEAI
jgi:hypothetical protein